MKTKIETRMAHLKIEMMQIRIYRINKAGNIENYWMNFHESINLRNQMIENEKTSTTERREKREADEKRKERRIQYEKRLKKAM